MYNAQLIMKPKQYALRTKTCKWNYYKQVERNNFIAQNTFFVILHWWTIFMVALLLKVDNISTRKIKHYEVLKIFLLIKKRIYIKCLTHISSTLEPSWMDRFFLDRWGHSTNEKICHLRSLIFSLKEKAFHISCVFNDVY